MTDWKYFYTYELWQKGKQTNIVTCYANSDNESIEKLSMRYNGVLKLIEKQPMCPYDPSEVQK